jgi:hypothetical protein
VKQELNMLPEDQQAEIARRRLICASCPFNSVNAKADGYQSSRVDDHCVLCGCTIRRKTASLNSKCGIDCCNPNTDCECKKPNLKKYNAEHNVVMQLKWDAYKTKENE